MRSWRRTVARIAPGRRRGALVDGGEPRTGFDVLHAGEGGRVVALLGHLTAPDDADAPAAA